MSRSPGPRRPFVNLLVLGEGEARRRPAVDDVGARIVSTAGPDPHDWIEPMTPDVHALREELEAELKDLTSSWEYAYAMGHGCTIGDHPSFQTTRRRAADLRARIAELTE
jgi:hypothetical protein